MLNLVKAYLDGIDNSQRKRDGFFFHWRFEQMQETGCLCSYQCTKAGQKANDTR